MNFNNENYELLLKLASMSDNWNDTLVFGKLEIKYKLAIQKMIELNDKEVWDIIFWIKNEWTLRIIESVNWCLISVITPTDDIWRPFLYKE